jgi:uncharacterized membrane protein
MWKPLAVILVGLLVFDAIYFQFVYGSFSKMIQKIQGSSISFRPEGAIVCYLALTGLLYYFIILPKLPATDAALLGLGTYAVYESTNYAVIKNWDPQVAVIDTLWGGALFYLVTSVVYWVSPPIR